MPKPKLNTTSERRILMSKIRSKNTRPELKLRKALWAVGLRYRINDKRLPGSPDIVIKKYKLAIFVDGEFWHGKDWETKKHKIKNNSQFWITKIERNIQRDKENSHQLQKMGFTILRFWSLEVEKKVGLCIKVILDYIVSVESKENNLELWHYSHDD